MPNKSRKKSCRRLAAKIPRKKTNLLPIFAVAAIVICAAIVFLANGSEDSTKNDDMSRGNSGVVTIAYGESLVIPTSDITTDASFYLVDVNGTNKFVCNWDHTFAAYLAKKRAEGKHYNVAVSHAVKKLVRLIFALQKSGKAYQAAA